MRHQEKTATLLLSIAIFSAAAAGETMAPASASSTESQSAQSTGRAQTNLQAKPALREQIDRTKEFLDEKEPEVDSQILRLKSDGLIDRRSTTKITSALDDARISMSGMAEGMQSDEQLDGWTARMIAYELGMAADTLAQQADKIETEVSESPAGQNGPESGDAASQDQRRELVATLRETSGLLKKAARAIARNVK